MIDRRRQAQIDVHQERRGSKDRNGPVEGAVCVWAFAGGRQAALRNGTSASLIGAGAQ